MVAHSMDGVFYLRPVFYVAVAFVIFFVLFGRKLWQVIAGILDKRIADISRQLDEAARLRAEAEAMLAEARAQRQATLAESEALVASAQDEARRLAQSMQAEAEATAARRERMALDRIDAAEKAVVSELRITAIDIAIAAAEQVLAARLTEDVDVHLIDQSIADLPRAMRAA
jgi:F-type H+-transporting ATPase subunit b